MLSDPLGILSSVSVASERDHKMIKSPNFSNATKDSFLSLCALWNFHKNGRPTYNSPCDIRGYVPAPTPRYPAWYDRLAGCSTQITPQPDVPIILQFIRELADYEQALHEVEATEDSLRATLSFPNDPPKRGSVYTALISPPPSAGNPSPIPVGMALYFYNYSTWRSAPGIYLEDLYVQPSARGNGYGFKLLKYLARQVLEVKGRRLEWSVLTWNTPSIKFYEQVGAKVMDEWFKMMVEGPALEKLAEVA